MPIRSNRNPVGFGNRSEQTQILDFGNPITLNQHIRWSDRGGTLTIHNGHTAKNQTLIRTFSSLPVRY